jgi:hypothetical protein
MISFSAATAQNILFLTTGLDGEYRRVFEEEAMGFLFEDGYIVFNDAMSEILTQSSGRMENIMSFAKLVEANYVALITVTDNETAPLAKIQLFRTVDGTLLQETEKKLIFKKEESPLSKVKRWGKDVGILIKPT